MTEEQKEARGWLRTAYCSADGDGLSTPISDKYRRVIKQMLDEPRLPAALTDTQVATVRKSLRGAGWSEAETTAPAITTFYAHIHQALLSPPTRPGWRVMATNNNAIHDLVFTDEHELTNHILSMAATGWTLTVNKTEVPA